MSRLSSPLGPVLLLDDLRNGQMHLAALFITPPGAALAPLQVDDKSIAPARLAGFGGVEIWRARFALRSDRAGRYVWDGQAFELAADLTRDLRIAYVSCNGQEHGDLDRNPAERNAMWARLRDDHAQQPFSLMLHGGDQIYADEATLGHKLSEDWPDELPRDPSQADLASLREHLERRFIDRYIAIYSAPDYAALASRVPSLMQWDDHDICDGWGSLKRSRTYSPVGQVLFSLARQAALLCQHGCIDGDLPPRFADAQGLQLGWQVALPGLRLLAPDLRGERTRREIMGPGGWAMMEQARSDAVPGRTFLMSSVPLLGPRLSVLEAVMILIPSMQKYEDDLRDQWQSRTHRDSWQRMLQLAVDIHTQPDQALTVLSGEIHLAGRADMGTPAGPLHPLVASGITHPPPPRIWARALGALASLGDSPLPDHPISIRRMPGRQRLYLAERNALILSRQDSSWQASWMLEESRPTPPLSI